MKEFKAIIVDDNQGASFALESLIGKIPEIHLVARATNGSQAIELIKANPVDILFLDVLLPDMKGTDVLRHLEYFPYTIFTTGHSEFALEAFELGAHDYLVKPITIDRFTLALNRALSRLRSTSPPLTEIINNQDSLVVRDGRKYIPILFSKILYITAHKNCTVIHLPEKEISTSKSLQYYEEKLPHNFCRIHRQTIINTRYIDYIQGQSNGSYEVYMNEEEKSVLVVGRNYAAILKQKMGI